MARPSIRAGWGMFYDAFSQDIFLGHAPYNCTYCPGPAYTGVGVAPIGFAGLSGNTIVPDSPVYGAASPLGSYFGVNPNIRTPYVQNWNLNIQHQITNKILAQFGIRRLQGHQALPLPGHQPAHAGADHCLRPLVRSVRTRCLHRAELSDRGIRRPGWRNFNVPRTNFPNLFYVNQEVSSANSIYNALQASLQMNSWHGLFLQANYAWSHAIDNASDLEDFIPNAAQPNNSWATNLERGNSSFDIRQRFSLNFSYQLPKYGGEYAKLKNGWGIDGVLNLQTGQPFTLNYNFEGDYSGSGEGFDRPDVVGPIRLRQFSGQLPRPDFVRCALHLRQHHGHHVAPAIATALPAPATSATSDAISSPARRSRNSTSRSSKTRS